MTLEAGKEMDRRCVMNWLMEVYRNPTVAFNAHSDEQLKELAYDALVLLREQETLLNKAYELLADMEMDFFCDDLMCDDGWCDEHCTTNGQTPECIERWFRKQILKGR